MVGQPNVALVEAARSGDPRALDELVAEFLPLVYSVVGRALARHADVDDVVQDTMLHVVGGLGGLRDPRRFRSWLVAVTMNQIREHHRSQRAAPAPEPAMLTAERADPGADFVEVTLTRLGLSGQRREVAWAATWLDPEDRHLLSLWWLEAAGRLTRTDLAAALHLNAHHVTVRVGRMKGRLETARLVVRALAAAPRCPELAELASPWPGEPTALWRKRFSRHIRECRECPDATNDLIPAERLLGGMGLLTLPAGYTTYILTGVHRSARIAPHRRAPGHRASSHRAGRPTGHLAGHLAAKPVVVGIAAIAAVTGTGLAAVYAIAPRPPAATIPTLGSTPASASPVSTSDAARATAPAPATSSQHPVTKAPTGTHPPATTTAHSTKAPAPPTPPPAAHGAQSPAQQVLALINQARTQAGLPAYTLTSGLNTSATKHNQTMADGCGLSHQCPGEPPLGTRETDAGVDWTAAGENIGEGGGVAGTNAAIAQSAVGLTQDMLDEQPPNDGHRLNILSSTYTHIGIAVYRDSSGTVWMTQDFSN
jgi:RNA polymerase sigma factor (sigma-70 family)